MNCDIDKQITYFSKLILILFSEKYKIQLELKKNDNFVFQITFLQKLKSYHNPINSK